MEQKFGDVKDRILTLAVNRASLGRPVPMEVDKVQATHWREERCSEGGYDWTEEEEAEVEIDYVGESCKGGGKGSVKGKGKAFGGECWTCGERGHRSNECTNHKLAQGDKQPMEIGSVEKETNVGGVWATAQVQTKVVQEEWKISRSKKNRRIDKLLTEKKKNHEKDVDDEKAVSDKLLMVKKKNHEKDVDDEKAVSICTVSEVAAWRLVGCGEITVDSAAEESVCPKVWGEAYPMRQPTRWLRFVNASGGQMGHYGEQTATFRAGGSEAVMSLGFQVSDAQKPLAAV